MILSNAKRLTSRRSLLSMLLQCQNEPFDDVGNTRSLVECDIVDISSQSLEHAAAMPRTTVR